MADTAIRPAEKSSAARGRQARIDSRERNERWKPAPFSISEEDCIRCDACMRHCPPQFGAIFNFAYEVIIIPELCAGCGKCAPACPMGSIGPDHDWQSSPDEWWALPGTGRDPHRNRKSR